MALDRIRRRFALAGFLAGIVVGQIVWLTIGPHMGMLMDHVLGMAVSSGAAYLVTAIPVIRQASSSQHSRTRWLLSSLVLLAVIFFGVVGGMFVVFGAPRVLASLASLMQIPDWVGVWVGLNPLPYWMLVLVFWATPSLIGALVGSRA
jgi:hypothetical protein